MEGQILTVGSEIILRWLTGVDGLLNNDNPIKQIGNGVLTEGQIAISNESEVSQQLVNMGLDKATGPY